MRAAAFAGVVLAASPALADPAICEVSPTALSFPVLDADRGERATLTLAVTNTAAPGADPCDFQLVAPTIFIDTGNFTAAPTWTGGYLEPGASASWAITFHPRTAGGQSQDLIVQDVNTGATLATVPVFAVGSYQQLTFENVSGGGGVLDLGAVPVGQTASAVVTAHAGDVAVEMFSAYVSDPTAIAIASGPTGWTTFPPFAHVEWTIACTPPAIGAASAFVNFDTYEFNYNFLASCTGVDPTPHVAVSTDTMVFVDTFRHPDEPSYEHVTVRNTGATTLELDAITVDGDGFSLAGPRLIALTLAPNETGDVTIAFAPAVAGDATGHLVIGTHAAPALATVELHGRGISRSVAVDPLTADLGNVYVGDVEYVAITLRDIDAAASFEIARIAVTGDAAYSLESLDRSTIGPGEQAVARIAFAPGAAGTATAQVAVYLDGDPDPHAQIALSANALAHSTGGTGCGCSGGDARGGFMMVGLAGLVGRRRRR